ncbi:LEAF RUST 10 DISEASE-RESISTANCE LOCUS RECEPTOR-LIKE PROTEIN KINASE-like 1.2 isoform X2 [Macadamia integrifolia]|uniref:LEAF RUST 10 DISEASE-RESISTANCE LOCUS RECEPTOR-LIKE PROTEIN KINASE-like 1.2 isoform X2 n=1 Tax=Macadamia integrifolia TaxID=60698 RepID=UPI001C4FB860|nr:LEAF RUST 10 DISEASE-RESISTANCE LOCUS RECEPTOR-LIKE PROTEIN KINASE-like 1.2 isoform X2 [Macadamia integrifolia]
MSYTFSDRDSFPELMNTTLFFLLLLLFTAVAQEAKSVDPKFEACEPRSCGYGPNVSYPFWIPLMQHNYCGHPDYEVTCLENQNQNQPALLISEAYYLIRDISYANHSLMVVNTEEESNSCSVPLQNFTIKNTPFEFDHIPVNLFFFYNCTRSVVLGYQSFQLNCSSSVTGNRSYVLFEHDLELPDLNYTLQTCKSTVSAPVYTNGLSLGDLQGMNYSTLMNRGFLLEWTENVNCSRCEASGGRCGYYEKQLLCLCPNGPNGQTCTGGMSLGTKFAIAAACFVVLLVFSFLVYIIYRRRRHPKEGLFTPFRSRSSSISTGPLSRKYLSNASMKDLEKGSTYFGVHVFTYAELEEATNNFNSNKELGDGGFGTVYHGKLRDGREVAVKRLYENNYRRVEQFMNEVEILNRLRHQNLVTLYGCTSRHSRELLLVYEYIPNGTVADHLHGDRAEAGSLTWPTRMSIAIETASALAYLHASDVIHRDVKTTNILLDSNFGVKVADFGLSRLFPNDVTHVSTAPQGTPGYVDPEYHQCYQLTDKSDVYSFGVVLVELISSKPAVDMNRHHNEINLANMAISKIQNQALHELVDTSLGYESDYAVKMMTTSVAELAFRCLQLEKEMRPSMDEVLETLKGIDKEDYKVEKADLVIQKDNVGLLKSIDPPFSPDSVTDKWVSRSTTPNTSA